MPGFNLVLSSEALNEISYRKWNTSFDISSEEIIEQSQFHYFSISKPDGYPFENFHSDSNLSIYLEGNIYNASPEEILNSLLELLKKEDPKLKEGIEQLQKEWYGDYVILLSDKKKKSWIIISNYFSKLPVYYSVEKNRIIVSRNYRFALAAKTEPLEIDKLHLASKLIFGYRLDERSTFKNIIHLGCLGFIKIDKKENGEYSILVSQEQPDLRNTPTSLSREKFISHIAEQHIETVKNVAGFAHKKNRTIISDLSGGIDTRINLGVFEKLKIPCEYHCFAVAGYYNEQDFAERIFQKINTCGKFSVLTSVIPESSSDKEISDLLLKTDCLVPSKPARISYEMARSIYLAEPGKEKLRFGGLGLSDFFRKGFRNKGFKSLFAYLNSDESFFISIASGCYMAGISENEFRDYLQTLIDSWPEKNIEDQLMKLFFLYQNNFCSGESEDNEREFAFNCNPMWEQNLILYVIRDLPLNWRSNYTAALFMNVIDPRLTAAPLNHQHIAINDLKKLRWEEFKSNRINHFRENNSFYKQSVHIAKRISGYSSKTENINQQWRSMIDKPSSFNFLNKLSEAEYSSLPIYRQDQINSLECYFEKINTLKDIRI